jgi:hypothetical protein
MITSEIKNKIVKSKEVPSRSLEIIIKGPKMRLLEDLNIKETPKVSMEPISLTFLKKLSSKKKDYKN